MYSSLSFPPHPSPSFSPSASSLLVDPFSQDSPGLSTFTIRVPPSQVLVTRGPEIEMQWWEKGEETDVEGISELGMKVNGEQAGEEEGHAENLRTPVFKGGKVSLNMEKGEMLR